MILSGASPLCEQLIKTIVVDVFLNLALTHRNVKIQAYKVIQILSSFFDIVYILRLDDEPTIVTDLLDTLIQDS
jgi:hypothetical protein